MAHFAKIVDGFVVRVSVVENRHLMDGDVEKESKGKEYLQKVHGSGHWVQCSYSGKKRGRFPSIGWAYDHVRDVFVPPKPFESWTLNEQKMEWEPPVTFPGVPAAWDEVNKRWIEV